MMALIDQQVSQLELQGCPSLPVGSPLCMVDMSVCPPCNYANPAKCPDVPRNYSACIGTCDASVRSPRVRSDMSDSGVSSIATLASIVIGQSSSLALHKWHAPVCAVS